MNRKDIDRLLVEAKRITNHPDFVIIGSLSVLGAVANPPVSMTGSIDIDLYPKNDPGRASEIAKALGLGSAFESTYGYYADAVSPRAHLAGRLGATANQSRIRFRRICVVSRTQ